MVAPTMNLSPSRSTSLTPYANRANSGDNVKSGDDQAWYADLVKNGEYNIIQEHLKGGGKNANDKLRTLCKDIALGIFSVDVLSDLWKRVLYIISAQVFTDQLDEVVLHDMLLVMTKNMPSEAVNPQSQQPINATFVAELAKYTNLDKLCAIFKLLFKDQQSQSNSVQQLAVQQLVNHLTPEKLRAIFNLLSPDQQLQSNSVQQLVNHLTPEKLRAIFNLLSPDQQLQSTSEQQQSQPTASLPPPECPFAPSPHNAQNQDNAKSDDTVLWCADLIRNRQYDTIMQHLLQNNRGGDKQKLTILCKEILLGKIADDVCINLLNGVLGPCFQQVVDLDALVLRDMLVKYKSYNEVSAKFAVLLAEHATPEKLAAIFKLLLENEYQHAQAAFVEQLAKHATPEKLASIFKLLSTNKDQQAQAAFVEQLAKHADYKKLASIFKLLSTNKDQQAQVTFVEQLAKHATKNRLLYIAMDIAMELKATSNVNVVSEGADNVPWIVEQFIFCIMCADNDNAYESAKHVFDSFVKEPVDFIGWTKLKKTLICNYLFAREFFMSQSAGEIYASIIQMVDDCLANNANADEQKVQQLFSNIRRLLQDSASGTDSQAKQDNASPASKQSESTAQLTFEQCSTTKDKVKLVSSLLHNGRSVTDSARIISHLVKLASSATDDSTTVGQTNEHVGVTYADNEDAGVGERIASAFVLLKNDDKRELVQRLIAVNCPAKYFADAAYAIVGWDFRSIHETSQRLNDFVKLLTENKITNEKLVSIINIICKKNPNAVSHLAPILLSEGQDQCLIDVYPCLEDEATKICIEFLIKENRHDVIANIYRSLSEELSAQQLLRELLASQSRGKMIIINVLRYLVWHEVLESQQNSKNSLPQRLLSALNKHVDLLLCINKPEKLKGLLSSPITKKVAQLSFTKSSAVFFHLLASDLAQLQGGDLTAKALAALLDKELKDNPAEYTSLKGSFLNSHKFIDLVSVYCVNKASQRSDSTKRTNGDTDNAMQLSVRRSVSMPVVGALFTTNATQKEVVNNTLEAITQLQNMQQLLLKAETPSSKVHTLYKTHQEALVCFQDCQRIRNFVGGANYTATDIQSLIKGCCKCDDGDPQLLDPQKVADCFNHLSEANLNTFLNDILMMERLLQDGLAFKTPDCKDNNVLLTVPTDSRLVKFLKALSEPKLKKVLRFLPQQISGMKDVVDFLDKKIITRKNPSQLQNFLNVIDATSNNPWLRELFKLTLSHEDFMAVYQGIPDDDTKKQQILLKWLKTNQDVTPEQLVHLLGIQEIESDNRETLYKLLAEKLAEKNKLLLKSLLEGYVDPASIRHADYLAKNKHHMFVCAINDTAEKILSKSIVTLQQFNNFSDSFNFSDSLKERIALSVFNGLIANTSLQLDKELLSQLALILVINSDLLIQANNQELIKKVCESLDHEQFASGDMVQFLEKLSKNGRTPLGREIVDAGIKKHLSSDLYERCFSLINGKQIYLPHYFQTLNSFFQAVASYQPNVSSGDQGEGELPVKFLTIDHLKNYLRQSPLSINNDVIHACVSDSSGELMRCIFSDQCTEQQAARNDQRLLKHYIDLFNKVHSYGIMFSLLSAGGLVAFKNMIAENIIKLFASNLKILDENTLGKLSTVFSWIKEQKDKVPAIKLALLRVLRSLEIAVLSQSNTTQSQQKETFDFCRHVIECLARCGCNAHSSILRKLRLIVGDNSTYMHSLVLMFRRVRVAGNNHNSSDWGLEYIQQCKTYSGAVWKDYGIKDVQQAITTLFAAGYSEDVYKRIVQILLMESFILGTQPHQIYCLAIIDQLLQWQYDVSRIAPQALQFIMELNPKLTSNVLSVSNQEITDRDALLKSIALKVCEGIYQDVNNKNAQVMFVNILGATLGQNIDMNEWLDAIVKGGIKIVNNDVTNQNAWCVFEQIVIKVNQLPEGDLKNALTKQIHTAMKSAIKSMATGKSCLVEQLLTCGDTAKEESFFAILESCYNILACLFPNEQSNTFYYFTTFVNAYYEARQWSLVSQHEHGKEKPLAVIIRLALLHCNFRAHYDENHGFDDLEFGCLYESVPSIKALYQYIGRQQAAVNILHTKKTGSRQLLECIRYREGAYKIGNYDLSIQKIETEYGNYLELKDDAVTASTSLAASLSKRFSSRAASASFSSAVSLQLGSRESSLSQSSETAQSSSSGSDDSDDDTTLNIFRVLGTS